MEIQEIFTYIFFIVVGFFIYYINNKLKNLASIEDIRKISYEQQKGLNLATKEDIEKITNDIESVKSKFQTFIDEHQIKFEKLHERRFDFLLGLYKKLHEIYKEINFYCEMMTCTDKKEFREFANKSYKTIYDVYDDYQKNSILSTERIDLLMEEMNNKYNTAIKKISIGANVTIRLNEGSYFNSEIVNNAYGQIEEGMKIFYEDIKDILSEIKKEFKELLNA